MAVPEPYKSANQWWYEDAINSFVKEFGGGMVDANSKQPYKRKNPGGGENREENANILIEERNIKITGIRCKNAQLGDCDWFFSVKSATSNKRYTPMVSFESQQYTGRWHDGVKHKICTKGSVVKWKCTCTDFKVRKKPCKHIISSLKAVESRIEGTRSGRLKR